MLCAGYLQRANIDATPDPPSLSIKLCSRTSKSLSLGVLTAINSHSSHQLLGNKMSFTLCFIHILFISNEFHKFLMSYDFRSRCTKNGQNWAKTQADRPLLVQPAWHP